MESQRVRHNRATFTDFQHQTCPQLSIIAALVQLLIISGAISNCPLLFPSSMWDTFQPGSSSSGIISFRLYMLFIGFSRQESWSGLQFLLQWITFCHRFSLWPIHLGWPCMAWLIASLSYTSSFSMTRLWYEGGVQICIHIYVGVYMHIYLQMVVLPDSFFDLKTVFWDKMLKHWHLFLTEKTQNLQMKMLTAWSLWHWHHEQTVEDVVSPSPSDMIL